MISSSAPAADAADATSASRRAPIPEFTLGERLSDEQRAFLDRHGYIRFRRFASPQTVHELAAEVEEIDRRLVREGRTIVNGVPLIIGRRADGSGYVQRMAFASTFGEKLHAFLERAEAFCRAHEIGYHRVITDTPVEAFVLAQLKGLVLA